MANVPKDYQAPNRSEHVYRKLGWLQEVRQQGDSFLKSTRTAVDMQQAIDIISGVDDERIPTGRSSLTYNRLKRQIREIVAVSSQLRPIEGFKSDNKGFERNVYTLNKLWKGWWGNTFADRGIRKAKQWAAVTGTGWVSPLWNNDFYVTGRGDIDLQTYGAMDVLPIQMPQDGNIQRAYAVMIKSEMPLAMAHAMFPMWADKITADRSSTGFARRAKETFSRFLSPILRHNERKSKDTPFPVCDICYTYIMDLTFNDTDRPIPMGDANTSWYYVVPPYGSETPIGQDDKGNTIIKKAGLEESMMYPLRRLMISFTNCVPYDNTSKFWHGKVPLVKFTCDDWPWEPLGFPLTKDGAQMQKSIVRIMRSIEENAIVRMDPPLAYDDAIAKTTMESFDFRAPHQRLAMPGMNLQDMVKPILDPRYYDIPNWIPEWINSLEQKMDYVAALNDMTALAKAAQIPSSDSIEKLMEMAGPLIQDIERNDEKSLGELAQMWMPMAFQFYTNFRTMQMLGKDGATPETFDYHPGDLVPSHVPGEDPEKASNFNRFQRAKFHMNSFFYQVVPGSGYQTTNMSRKLLYAQLERLGFPLDPWTLSEVFDVANFGNPPENTKTVMERWVAWQYMRSELATDIQTMQAQAAAAAQGGAAPVGTKEAGTFALEFLDKIFGTNRAGRPPAFNRPPTIQSKDGGTRSTITTS